MSRLILLIRCLGYALRRGTARKSLIGAPRAFAVFQSSKLGDMVCTTPIFSALKRAYPDANVTVVGNAVNARLLMGHPHVDDYVEYRSDRVWELITELRSGGFDAAIMASQNFTGTAAMFLAGIPVITALRVADADSPNETLSYRALSCLVTTVPVSNFAYIPREYLRLLEPLGIRSCNATKTLAVSTQAVAEALQLLAGLSGTLVGIVPSAGDKIKEWPPDRFAQVADHLIERGCSVVLLGGPGDGPLCDIMLGQMAHRDAVRNLSPGLSIELLKAVISRLSLLVCADTGPVHVAHAFGIATVDIVGPVSEDAIPPRGPRNVVVVPQRDKPVIYPFTVRIRDAAEARRQAEAVTVDDVMVAVNGLLDS